MMDTSRRPFRNSDQDPVVKSWNRVPTPITEIGRHAELVGAVGAGHARRAEVERMGGGERALPGLGLHERDVVALDEGGQHVLGFGVQHFAAGDDHRPGGLRDHGRHLGDLARIGLGPADAPGTRLEEIRHSRSFSAWTSWQKATTGPAFCGSVITPRARGSAVKRCSGLVIRS